MARMSASLPSASYLPHSFVSSNPRCSLMRRCLGPRRFLQEASGEMWWGSRGEMRGVLLGNRRRGKGVFPRGEAKEGRGREVR
eukprot:1969937-Rhodomonas_salina.1